MQRPFDAVCECRRWRAKYHQAKAGLALVSADVSNWCAFVAAFSPLDDFAQAADILLQSPPAVACPIFLANVSHELRTPLNAIIGYSELLIEETSPTQVVVQKDLANILSSGRYLLALVDDVLDLSKIEAGEMKLVNKPTALKPLLAGAVETVRSLAEQHGNQLSLVLPEEDVVLHTDHLRVKQILVNILSNACKFTQQGEIDCTLFCERQADVEGVVCDWACIVVADTGIGMSPDELKQVLEPFVQAEKISRSHSGTGLGLAITQQLTQLLGGSIFLESQPGVGTTVTLKLPIHPDSTADGPYRWWPG